MMVALYAAFFITVTLAVYACYAVPSERKQKIRARLAILTAEEAGRSEAVPAAEPEQESFAHRILRPVLVWSRRQFRRRFDERKQWKLEQLIAQAGRPMQMSPVEFRLLQLAVFVGLPLLSSLYGLWVLQMNAGSVILLALAGCVLAWRLPYMYLAVKSKRRAKEILRQLPDTLDLLTVSLEAGLGFDAALGKLVSKKGGPLPEELHRCLEEIRLGRTRREALLGLRDRIALEEIRSLVSSILQAEKLGIGMVQVLRAQSIEMREKRKQRAEEAAMKAPIKMLFPLVLFIFPCLFIVLLGPVLIQMMETFGGG